MGQYWRVVNLDKCESYWLSKLGESLNGGVECFKHLMPILLPDCDSTVQRYRPGESLWPESIDTYFFAKTASRSLATAALVNFPVETIQEIHSHIEDFGDVVCFSMTCQVLWEIGRSEIYRRITTLATNYSWAGDRIVCIGDYLRNDDIPEALLSAEEKEDLLLDEDNNERTLYNCPFYETTKPVSLLTLLAGQRDAYLWRDMQVFHQLCETSPMLPPLPGLHVLRNLTRKQYVRESAILVLRDKYRGTMNEIDEVGFGEVVLFRICLSSDDSMSLAYAGDIAVHRGVWAGDRFDVVSADWLETASGWTDVSDEALKEVEAIWVAEYGSTRALSLLNSS